MGNLLLVLRFLSTYYELLVCCRFWVTGRETQVGKFASWRVTISVTMEQWTIRLFARNSFVRNDESMFTTQGMFRRYFNVDGKCRNSKSQYDSTMGWGQAVRSTKKTSAHTKTANTPKTCNNNVTRNVIL